MPSRRRAYLRWLLAGELAATAAAIYVAAVLWVFAANPDLTWSSDDVWASSNGRGRFDVLLAALASVVAIALAAVTLLKPFVPGAFAPLAVGSKGGFTIICDFPRPIVLFDAPCNIYRTPETLRVLLLAGPANRLEEAALGIGQMSPSHRTVCLWGRRSSSRLASLLWRWLHRYLRRRSRPASLAASPQIARV